MDNKIEELREWMVANGCLIHKDIQIPSNINGVQGVSTTKTIPHKTLILAVPSKLLLTVSKCYKDKELVKLFAANDDLFDYQASDDAEFNVLCVFMMYHKINIQKSPWREYLQTIAEPQTAVDWSTNELQGLNLSILEQVIHVGKQCRQLQQQLVKYLQYRQQFPKITEKQLRKMFNYCYRAVMTRCFGYYFNEASLIPVADLINHGCTAINHQLIHLNYEMGKQQISEGYKLRKDRIDCSLIGLEKPNVLDLPFREKFIIDKGIIVATDIDRISQLTRKKIDQLINEYNAKLLVNGGQLSQLQFCEQDDQEDNDTDEEEEQQQERQILMLRKNQEEQMAMFKQNHVVVVTYAEIEQKLRETGIVDKEGGEKDGKQITVEGGEQGQKCKQQTENYTQKIDQNLSNLQDDFTRQNIDQATEKSSIVPKSPTTQFPCIEPTQTTVTNNQTDNQDSQDDSDSQQDKWGLEESAYFTMSTSSIVPGNRQLYNSYGSRTNRFLLIWYGFSYADNLYDSVSFRMQVQFQKLREPQQIVLDSYFGGQGLSFRKANHQLVKSNEISRQFRLKRSKLCNKLIIFLRLFLLNFYKGQDLYKLFVTFPASLAYELYVMRYYVRIVQALYRRYPQETVFELEKQLTENNYKLKYKLIYLKQQRKILDINIQALHTVIRILQGCKMSDKEIPRKLYVQCSIEMLRVIKEYLEQINKCYPYIVYEQPVQTWSKIGEKTEGVTMILEKDSNI